MGSPLGLYDSVPWERYAARTSYVRPVSLPSGDPGAPPTVGVEIAAEWIPYICGSLTQLLLPTTWDTADPATLITVLERVADLIALIGTAGPSMQSGTVTLTIAAGDASASGLVTFPSPFSSTPVVVTSADTGQVVAAAAAVSDTAVVLSVTAAVPALATTNVVVSWLARVAT